MLTRRTLLASAMAATVLPSIAHARIGMDYKPGLVDKLLADGKTVFVDFYTDWCSTCAAQERAINALLKQNPAYQEQIEFVSLNWDYYSKDALSQRLNIPRRSTLVVLKGDQELGRIVAGTRKADIKALMDRALKAAMA